ncbi:MAG: DNA-binding protein [Candidatus Krumholzibacteriia bacterium]
MSKHAIFSFLMIGLLAVVLGACSDGGDQAATGAAESASATSSEHPGASKGAEHPGSAPTGMPAGQGGFTGEILETMNSGGYTYVKLDTGKEQVWAAATETQVAVGQRVTVPAGMLMKDFPSKTLDRTFPEIWFVGGIYPEGQAANQAQGGMPPSGMGGMPSGGMEQMANDGSHNQVPDAGVEPVAKVAGGHDIAGIYAGAAELGGKTVKVRGRVVKFTPNIMGTNWIHIQDGSGEGPSADLTVTSSGSVSVDDVVVVEGVLAVDKDFGAGYRYSAIIENAKITKD